MHFQKKHNNYMRYQLLYLIIFRIYTTKCSVGIVSYSTTHILSLKTKTHQ